MNLWHLLRPWLRQRWKSLTVAVFLAVLAVLAGIGLFSVAGWFLAGAFLAGAGAVFNIFIPSALIRSFSFWRIAARWGERVMGHTATLSLLVDIRTAVFAHLATLSPVQLAQYQEGDLVARLSGDIDTLDTVFLLLLAPLLTALIAGALFSLLAGVYVPMLAWTVFAILMVSVCVIPFLLTRWATQPGQQAQQAASEARALVHDMVAAHLDIAVFVAQPATTKRFNQAAFRLAAARDDLARIGATGQFLQQLMMGACVLALLGMGMLAYQQGRLSGPVWVGLILGGIALFEVLGPLMRGTARLGMAMAAAQRLREVLVTTPAVRDSDSPVVLPEQGAIQLHDINFSWQGADRSSAVLTHLDLFVPQGQQLAVVGASGAGKSTLLALIMRIVDPDSGQLSYGGVPLKNVRQADLHQRFTFLSQHSPVFLGTLRSNLLMGNAQAMDAQLMQALDRVGLEDFVLSLHDGLDTWVGEAGRNLSTGQVRRLCLARALLTPATVWVLDEPTVGLDLQAQTEFFNDLRQAAAGRTVIIATHAKLPPGTVDRILVLENGQLHESQY